MIEKSLDRRFNHIIGFIKTQEVETLRPLMEKSDVMIETLEELTLNSVKEKKRDEEIALPRTNQEKTEDKNPLSTAQEVKALERHKEKLEALRNNFSKLLASVKQKNRFGKVTLEIEGMSIQDINKLKESLSYVY